MSDQSPLAIQPNVYYTLDETASLLRVSRESVRRLVESRQNLGIRLGRQWRILGAALLDLPGNGASEESEAEELADWRRASERSLLEVWDNDEDAVYDHM